MKRRTKKQIRAIKAKAKKKDRQVFGAKGASLFDEGAAERRETKGKRAKEISFDWDEEIGSHAWW